MLLMDLQNYSRRWLSGHIKIERVRCTHSNVSGINDGD